MKAKKKVIVILIAVLAAIGIGVGVSVFLLAGNNGSETANDETTTADVDADTYYSSNAKIVSQIEAKNSADVTTEAQTLDLLKTRGFTDYSVETEYSMDGEYSEAADISDSSSTKHPIYQTYYVSSGGDMWTIFVTNGKVMAYPVSYNMQSELSVDLVISESETVMSYDSGTNKFYETIPNETALIVKKVSGINADTLDKLTIEEIDKL